mmetsp:Transcript_1863/g.3258  ORF Transcript_1863/g.3258 Transcript_1863/m.3258 type:complete len:175 (-) Transcript_1863:1037-1561(-)
MGQTEVHEHVYKHSWETVTLAHWKKYPNTHCPQVLEVDILDRAVDSATGRMFTKRLFTGQSPVPSFLSWLIKPEPAYAIECSMVDPKEKKMVLNLKSLSYSNLIQVNETCTYEPHPENQEWTVFRQEWRCDWNAPTYLKNRLDSLSVQRFRDSVMNGRRAIQEICNELEAKWRS